jgi:hypothetical protein
MPFSTELEDRFVIMHIQHSEQSWCEQVCDAFELLKAEAEIGLRVQKYKSTRFRQNGSPPNQHGLKQHVISTRNVDKSGFHQQRQQALDRNRVIATL